MIALLKKTTGSACAELSKELETIEKRFEKHCRAFPSSLDELREEYGRLAADWEKKPDANSASALVSIQSKIDATIKVFTDLSERVKVAKKAARANRELIRAAFDEVLAGLDREREAIIADDRKKSETLGLECVSTEALHAIDQARERLQESRAWIRADPESSLNHLWAYLQK